MSRLLAFFSLFILLTASTAFAQTTDIDDGEVGIAYSYTIVINWGENGEPDGLTYTHEDLPDGLSINQTSGEISGVPTLAGDYISTITLSFDGTTNDIQVSLTIDPQSGTPAIDSASVSIGTVGIAYDYTITATNSPTTFNVNPSDLPAGLSANASTGLISGTPTEPGSFSVTISANNGTGTGGEFTLSLTIQPAGDLPEITSSASLSGDKDELLTYQITASNSPTLFEASNLPPGVTMADTSTGFISGTPTVEGSFDVSLRAKNEFGWSDSFTLTVTIGAIPQISSALELTLNEALAMEAFLVTASNNPTALSVTGLPNGLIFDGETNQITGTPMMAGETDVSIYAVNGVGQGPTATMTITVEAREPAPPALRPASFSLLVEDGSPYVQLTFDQSADDLAAFDYFIETSVDLETWESTALADSSLSVEATDNGDGITTVVVKQSQSIDAATPQFIRYRVATKSE